MHDGNNVCVCARAFVCRYIHRYIVSDSSLNGSVWCVCVCIYFRSFCFVLNLFFSSSVAYRHRRLSLSIAFRMAFYVYRIFISSMLSPSYLLSLLLLWLLFLFLIFFFIIIIYKSKFNIDQTHFWSRSSKRARSREIKSKKSTWRKRRKRRSDNENK